MRFLCPVPLAMLASLCTTPALAQQPQGPPLLLVALQQAAIENDPRMRQLALLAAQTSLRLENVAAQWKPSVAIESVVQFQTDAPTAPVLAPGAQPVFAAPKENYDVFGRVEQRLFDPTVSAQAAFERAQLLEQQARVQTTVYALRQQVNDAFFATATLQQRAAVVAGTVSELEGRLREAAARVREGTALPADAAAIEATLLQRRQDESELRSAIRAALARLATVVGRPIPTEAVPVIPERLGALVASTREQLLGVRSRPEYAQFARTRERIGHQRDVAGAQSQPRLSAFARVGYGRPALDFIQNEWQPYGIGGVRLQWNAWNWGITAREREVQALQDQIVGTEEAAFSRSIAAAIEGDLATIEHLTEALAADQRIIELRAEVERAARVRLQEGVLTSSDYLARDTELLQARIAQATHQVQLAEARARLLTTVGVEVQ